MIQTKSVAFTKTVKRLHEILAKWHLKCCYNLCHDSFNYSSSCMVPAVMGIMVPNPPGHGSEGNTGGL